MIDISDYSLFFLLFFKSRKASPLLWFSVPECPNLFQTRRSGTIGQSALNFPCQFHVLVTPLCNGFVLDRALIEWSTPSLIVTCASLSLSGHWSLFMAINYKRSDSQSKWLGGPIKRVTFNKLFRHIWEPSLFTQGGFVWSWCFLARPSPGLKGRTRLRPLLTVL